MEYVVGITSTILFIVGLSTLIETTVNGFHNVIKSQLACVGVIFSALLMASFGHYYNSDMVLIWGCLSFFISMGYILMFASWAGKHYND